MVQALKVKALGCIVVVAPPPVALSIVNWPALIPFEPSPTLDKARSEDAVEPSETGVVPIVTELFASAAFGTAS